MVIPDILRSKIKNLLVSSKTDILIYTSSIRSRALSYIGSFMEIHSPRASGDPSVLVIAPTKELAEQLYGFFDSVKPPTAIVLSVIGGSDKNLNVSDLSKGCDYLVGTPGRLDWLFKEGRLNVSCLQVVVLEDADILLTSPLVLDFLEKAVPITAQRILCSSNPINAWLKDTLSDVLRVGHQTLIDDSIEVPLLKYDEHYFSLVSSENELRQLRYLLDTYKKGVLVFCRSKAQVASIATNPMFLDLQPVTSDMSEINRSTLSGSSVLTTVACMQENELGVFKVAIFLGPPSDSIARYKKLICLVRKKDKYPTYMKPFPVVSSDELMVTFARHQLDQLTTTESSPAFPPHLLPGLVSLAAARKDLFERRSPFSGLPGYSPILLLDPYLKKFKSIAMVEKLMKEVFPKHGRIALSEKGYIVDLPTEDATHCGDHPRLSNVKTVFLTVLPRLVLDKDAFVKRQIRRDRRTIVSRNPKPHNSS